MNTNLTGLPLLTDRLTLVDRVTQVTADTGSTVLTPKICSKYALHLAIAIPKAPFTGMR